MIQSIKREDGLKGGQKRERNEELLWLRARSFGKIRLKLEACAPESYNIGIAKNAFFSPQRKGRNWDSEL